MPAKKRIPKETALYRPLAEYLRGQGYKVHSEVRGCDIVAARGEELVVIELKNKFCAQLLVQATQRQRVADSVYVALARPDWRQNRAHWRHIQHLLRRLELGLILVSSNGYQPAVEILFHPLPFTSQKSRKKRRAIIAEIEARSGDYNEGGSTRRGIVTAYREEAIFIAACLAKLGASSPKALRDLGAGPRTPSILLHDFYGWFEHVAHGLYGIKPAGRAALKTYAQVVKGFKTRLPRA